MPVEPVHDYLAELQAADCSPLTLKSYAVNLLDWFRFLAAAGIGWQDASRYHIRDWVLRLRGRPTPPRTRGGGGGRAAPGIGNPHGKPSRRAGYVKGAQTRTWLVTCWFGWDDRSVR
jgi:integrase/recombinase XerC